MKNLTQQHGAMIAAILATTQFSSIRRRFVADAKTIVDSPQQIEQLSRDKQVTVPDLKEAVKYLANQDGKFDAKTLKQYGNAVAALITAPKLQNVWNDFTAKLVQVGTDQFAEITRLTSLKTDDVRTQITEIRDFAGVEQGQTMGAGTTGRTQQETDQTKR